MSDDFDKEAEREKLREKYEQDKQKREATEQMSELLLQGATMTNGHCSECGDPIFRYDGQEFCPTCEKPIDSENGTEKNGDDEEIEVRSPSDEGRVAFGSDSAAEQGATEQARQPTPDSPRSTTDSGASQERKHQQPGPQPDQGQVDALPGGAPEGGSLERAEQSLVRTLTRFSEQADATDDPLKAKEQLAAAKEAAEALAALRR